MTALPAGRTCSPRRAPCGWPAASPGGLDLAAQARDADVDRAVERLPFAVAGQRENPVARQHLVRMLDEGPAAGRTPCAVIGTSCPTASKSWCARQIEKAFAHRDARLRCGGVSSEAAAPSIRRRTLFKRARSSRGSKGFVDVVVGADLEADHPVDDVGSAGDHDDAARRSARAGNAPAPGRPRRAGRRRAAPRRQHALDRLAHRLAAVGERDLVTVRGKIFRQQVADLGIVVDDQDAPCADRLPRQSIRLYKPATSRLQG